MAKFEMLTPAKEAELKENLWKICKFEKAIKKVSLRNKPTPFTGVPAHKLAQQHACTLFRCPLTFTHAQEEAKLVTDGKQMAQSAGGASQTSALFRLLHGMVMN